MVSSLKVGGMEQFVLRMAAEQARQGDAPSIVALQGGPLLDAARAEGLDVTVLGGTNKFARALRGLLALATVRPDLVHVHNPTSLHYARLWRRFRHVPILMTRHGQDSWRPDPSVWKNLDGVIAVSAAAAVVTRADNPDYASRVFTVLNGVKTTPPQRPRVVMRAELELGDRVAGIIVARLNTLKGHADLLQALALLKDPPHSPILLMAGNGPEEAPLRALADSLELGPEQVRFLGFRTDVADLLGAVDFFALPSLTEGLPLSVLEAMAQGLPIVATPVGGIPEVVREGVDGFLTPVNDPRALAERISALCADPSLRARMGAAGAARVRDDFSFDAMLARYHELYARSIQSAGA